MTKKKTPKKDKRLDLRQQRFCEEYIIDWNGTRAAIAAGYTKRSSRTQASKLLTKGNIKEYISECKNKIEELAGVSKLRALKKLSQIAFADITKAYDDNGVLKPFDKMPDDVKAAFEGITTLSIMQGNAELESFKVSSSVGAMKELAKLLGWYAAEKVDLNVSYDIEL